MSWNDSGNKNPWNGKQPPDLEEALKRFQKQLNGWFGRKAKVARGGSSSPFGKIPVNLVAHNSIFFIIGIVGVILWALSGIFIVNPAEQAAVLYFGKYAATVDPGPHWIPTFIAKKVVRNVDRVSDYSYSGQMLTKDENLVSVSIAVQYRIVDLNAYLFSVSDPGASLQQATSSALRQVVGTTTLDQLITAGREIWGSQVQESLVNILKKYNTGIQIISVAPQPARAPENVQSSFDDAIKAQEDERRFIEQAHAYEAKVVPIAKGQQKRIHLEAEAFAKQVVFEAQGQTAEFLQLLPQYLEAPKITAERMYIETMQAIMSKNPKIFIDAKQAPNLYLPFMKKAMTNPDKAIKASNNDWQTARVLTDNNHTSDDEDVMSSRISRGMRRN